MLTLHGEILPDRFSLLCVSVLYLPLFPCSESPVRSSLIRNSPPVCASLRTSAFLNSSPLARRIPYPQFPPRPFLFCSVSLPMSGCTTPADETRTCAPLAVGGLFAPRLDIDWCCGSSCVVGRGGWGGVSGGPLTALFSCSRGSDFLRRPTCLIHTEILEYPSTRPPPPPPAAVTPDSSLVSD